MSHALSDDPPATSPIGLDQLPRGVSATVTALAHTEGEAAQALALRLMEIGFLPGERVRVLAQGFPAADPLAVRVGQATFALRRHEAALVQVQPEEQGAMSAAPGHPKPARTAVRSTEVVQLSAAPGLPKPARTAVRSTEVVQ